MSAVKSELKQRFASALLSSFAGELQHCVCCQQQSALLVCDACASCIECFDNYPDDNENKQSFINTRPDVAKAIPKLKIHRLIAIGPHQGLLLDLINQFKYGKKQILTTTLASLLQEKIASHYTNLSLPEALVPIPMHPLKRLFRGFNQTELLYQHLLKSTGILGAANAVVRIRYSNPQAGKTGKQRRDLTRQVFKVKDINAVNNLTHIALLDDVITTGTTMHQLIKALLEVNPALRIDLWSLSVSL